MFLASLLDCCNRLTRWSPLQLLVVATVRCIVTELQFFRKRSVSDRNNCVIAQLRGCKKAPLCKKNRIFIFHTRCPDFKTAIKKKMHKLLFYLKISMQKYLIILRQYYIILYPTFIMFFLIFLIVNHL